MNAANIRRDYFPSLTFQGEREGSGLRGGGRVWGRGIDISED